MFSHAAVAGNTVYTAGQTGIVPDGLLADGFEAQAGQAFENLAAVLRASGAGLSDFVTATVLLTERADVRKYLPLAKKHLPQQPASHLQIVAGLAMPGLLLETEAIAVASGT